MRTHRHSSPIMGPTPAPIVPLTGFSRVRLSKDQQDAIWDIIAPTIHRSMNRLPLWKVFTAVYLEGLNHGAGVERERRNG